MHLSIDKKLVRKHFDRYAAQYDQFASLQQEMAECLLNQVVWGTEPNRILEIGCGTGSLTQRVLETYPTADVTINDISTRMLEMATVKLERYKQRISVIDGDAEAWLHRQRDEGSNEAADRWDFIVSNAAFQWFNDPVATAKACLKRLTEHGVLALSTFGPRTFAELHHAFALAEMQCGLPVVRRGQLFVDQAAWEQVCEGTDWSIQWIEQERTLYFKSVGAFLDSIKRIGATSAQRQTAQLNPMLNKTLLKTMEKQYIEHYSSAEGITATYHLCFGIFRRKSSFVSWKGCD